MGEAESKDKAEKICYAYKECPYVNLMATNKNRLYAIYFLPRKQQWWIEYIEKRPRVSLGLSKAEVIIVEKVYYPHNLRIRLPKKKSKISPCGADCSTCRSFSRCLCCPATIYYKGEI